MDDRTVWISLDYATFGLVMHGGIIIDAPPITRWTLGKRERYIATYYRKHGAIFRTLP